VKNKKENKKYSVRILYMENKVYKYVGITVIAFLVITLVIRLFYLNTQVIEGLTVSQMKNERNADKEDKVETAMEDILDKITKTNEDVDEFIIEIYKDNKEVTQDILLEIDNYCDKMILYLTLGMGDKIGSHPALQGFNKISKEIKEIEKLVTLKEAVEQSTKYLTEEDTTL
jgi:cell division protein FtsI/penicillin-binding protein 2